MSLLLPDGTEVPSKRWAKNHGKRSFTEMLEDEFAKVEEDLAAQLGAETDKMLWGWGDLLLSDLRGPEHPLRCVMRDWRAATEDMGGQKFVQFACDRPTLIQIIEIMEDALAEIEEANYTGDS